MATLLRLRPFDGLENFSSFTSIRRALESEGIDVLREKGVHLMPFQLPVHGLLQWCDQRFQVCRGLMINLCVLGRKR